MKYWTITKWCKSITDDGKDLYTHKKIEAENVIQFRLLDDDRIIYGYGEMDRSWFDKDNENGFEPLDYYMNIYGTTIIQIKIDGEYKTL